MNVDNSSSVATTHPPANAAGEPSHALQCMEVWSGNRRVQNTITVPGLDAWIFSEPHRGDEAGGDIHYVSMCGAGKISRFAIADVSGHGANVGDIAARLRKLMRKHINKLDQSRFARALNQEFGDLAEMGHFATALLTTYFAPTDHLVICNAGHPRPLWYRSESDAWELADRHTPHQAQRVGNLPLGVIGDTDYTQFAIKLGKGDLILIYTDSLIETFGTDGEPLGEQGLLDLARSLPQRDPARITGDLLEAVKAYGGGKVAADDETLLVLHHNASDPPRQSLTEKMRVVAKMLGLAGE